MLNQVVMCGRITDMVLVQDEEDNVTHVNMFLSVPRSYKNDNGEYETDIIPLTMEGDIAKNIATYCNENDLVGVKGRLTMISGNIDIKVERVTFLSSNKKED